MFGFFAGKRYRAEILERAAVEAADIPNDDASIIRLNRVTIRCGTAVRLQRSRSPQVDSRLLAVAAGVTSEAIRRWRSRASGESVPAAHAAAMVEQFEKQLRLIQGFPYDTDRADELASRLAARRQG